MQLIVTISTLVDIYGHQTNQQTNKQTNNGHLKAGKWILVKPGIQISQLDALPLVHWHNLTFLLNSSYLTVLNVCIETIKTKSVCGQHFLNKIVLAAIVLHACDIISDIFSYLIWVGFPAVIVVKKLKCTSLLSKETI